MASAAKTEEVMNKSRWILLNGALIACVLAMTSAAAERVSTKDDGEETVVESERPIRLKDVPVNARRVIEREAGQHSILEINEVSTNGAKSYEADWVVGNDEVSIRVSPDGVVLEREIEPLEVDDEEDD